MQSMTGYARLKKEFADIGEIEVVVKSINGRFLEPRLHLPRELASLEPQIRSELGKKLFRGTVDVSISVSRRQNGAIRINNELAKNWLKAVREVAKALKLKGEPTIQDLLATPELFAPGGKEDFTETNIKKLATMVYRAIDLLIVERRREGESIKKDLLQLIGNIGDLRTKMEKLREKANSEMGEKMRERLERALSTLAAAKFQSEVVSINEQKLIQEIAVLHDRVDISEELVRLSEHLRNYRDLIMSQEATGKKLDFYAQELLREVNTIGSKSHHAGLTQLVVEAKSAIEKVREQVQNVE